MEDDKKVEKPKEKVVYQVKNVHYTNAHTNILSHFKIMQWINDVLKADFKHFEEFRTGAVYCQLIDMLFPGVIPMKQVHFQTNIEDEYTKNFVILQRAFRDLKIMRSLPIQRLVQGHYPENRELFHWFYMFYNANYKERDYDPVAARFGQKICIGPKPIQKSRKLDELEGNCSDSSLSTPNGRARALRKAQPPPPRKHWNY